MTLKSDEFDVVIVGAGPAGAVLSYLLARSGVSILLIEQDASFERNFRGPAYQPSIIHLFNQMGILDEILSIPHASLDHFTASFEGKELFTLDLSFLPPPFRYALAMDQGPLLKKLVTLAGEFPNFTFVGDATLTSLTQEKISFTRGDSSYSVKARLVVGADGRFSTVREKAGICMHPADAEFDLVWFDLPEIKERPYTLGLEMTAEGILIVIPGEKKLRVGWLIEKGSFQKILQEGIDAFKKRIGEIDPVLKESLKENIQLTLLDVKVATAEHWMKKGVILIGDSAHTASPIGAQGNKLAIQDAVDLHPIICEALKSNEESLSESHFADFIEKRQRETARIFKRQQIMASLLSKLQRSPFKRALAKWLAPLAMRFLFKPFAWGFRETAVQTSLFHFETGILERQCYHLLKVQKIVKETDDTTSIYFSIPKKLKKLYAFLPGQFVTLRLLDRGQLLRRCYSISSIPEDPLLRITVKRKEDGLFSKDLVDTVKVGESLLVLPPGGQFTPATYATEHFFLAGGSGITPILPMIRSTLHSDDSCRVTLTYASKRAASVIFEKELARLKKAFPNRLTLHLHSSDKSKTPTEESISATLPKLTPRVAYYLCGPDGLMQLGLSAMKKQGVPLSQIHTEIYTSLLSPFEKTIQEKRPLISGSGKTEDQWPKTCSVSLRQREYQLAILQDETLLDAALRQGLAAPFSCREGICGTCTAHLTEGKVIMPHYDALSEVDRAEGKILTCQARPLTSSCKIEYQV